jgi:hypothetical protein
MEYNLSQNFPIQTENGNEFSFYNAVHHQWLDNGVYYIHFVLHFPA